MNNKITVGNIFKISIFILALIQIITSGYLIYHYYSVIYPKTLDTDSICNLSSYFNCDVATFSPLSNFFGVPTAVFGLIIGIIFLCTAFTNRSKIIKTNYSIAFLNFFLCLALLFYSIFFLKGLCPGCTIYYITSFAIFFIYFFKFEIRFGLHPSVLGVYGIIFAGVSLLFFYHTQKEEEAQKVLFEQIFEQFKIMPAIKDSKLTSSFTYPPNLQNKEKYPIKLEIFTDFECGFCKRFAMDILSPLKRKYENTLAIEYFFFPLDSSCNDNLKTPMHPNGCRAAKYAICSKQNFEQVHDELYENMNNLDAYLDNAIKNEKIKECINSDKTSKTLQNMITEAEKINLEGTPTILINGKKFGSAFPLRYFILLFDALLKQKSV